MAKQSQFEEFFEEFEQGKSEDQASICAVCETMLPEAVDGTLTEAEQLAFDKHVAHCAECARELADARRGAAWLSLLKSKAPEPPAGLLAKILSGTTGAAEHEASVTAPRLPVSSLPLPSPVAPAATAAPIAAPAWKTEASLIAVDPRRESSSLWAGLGKQRRALASKLSDVFSIESARMTFHPRLAMTTAMAFFSIALTLNLTGVRLRDLRASNFTPSGLMRSMADAEASATRLFQNNREVYQVESRLSELRSDDTPESSSPAGHR